MASRAAIGERNYIIHRRNNDMKKNYDIAAFIWPAYTGDEPRTKIFWDEDIGEWQTVRDAYGYKKSNGYVWERKPLLGFQNEADPKVMEMQMLDHIIVSPGCYYSFADERTVNFKTK